MAQERRYGGERIDVVVKRFILTPHDAQLGLMRVFGLEQSAANRFVRSLPAVAKHGADRAAAERYAAALHSIGAEVELVDSVSGAPFDADATSLPAPSSSLAPAFAESMRVSRAADEAVARFREEEARAGARERPWGADHDPVIPQAPRLPHDLSRMPNTRVAISTPPWQGDGPVQSPSPNHADARHPPPRTSLGGTHPAPVKPGEIGLGHPEAAPPTRPGAGPPLVLSLPPAPERRSRLPWLLAVALVAAAVFGLDRLGVFGDEADTRRAAWSAEGIEAGDHAPLPDWLDRPERKVEGISQAELRALINGLHRAGAQAMWAIRIKPLGDDTEQAEAVLIELPRDAAARRTVFWQLGRSKGQDSSRHQDRGQRFHEVAFR